MSGRLKRAKTEHTAALVPHCSNYPNEFGWVDSDLRTAVHGLGFPEQVEYIIKNMLWLTNEGRRRQAATTIQAMARRRRIYNRYKQTSHTWYFFPLHDGDLVTWVWYDDL